MNQTAAYIIPNTAILNPELIQPFENFGINDSILLRSTLYLNLVENFISKDSKTDFYFYLDIGDKDFITDEFRISKLNLKFGDLSNKNLFFENLSSKEFSSYKNNTLINSDLIGLNILDLEKLTNLLNIEDESLLINKSKSGDIGIFGFNNYSNEIFKSLINANFKYDEFLSRIKSLSHFIHTTNDILLIKNINDFRQLYFELSQKKSIEYCSQKMHERFTHLFIEYKDLLK